MISEFGASPSKDDNTSAFADAVEWLNDQTNPPCLIFEPGIYPFETSPNWAVDYATITNCGTVRLRNTGTGDAFILDGGSVGVGITDMHVGRFLIEGHDGSGHGVYERAIHRSHLSFNVRGCGTTKAAFYLSFGVVTEYQITTSVNEGGWYNDGTGEAEPLYGVYCDWRNAGEPVSYCTFINPIIEGVGTGTHIERGIGNQFYGGTMEACATYGMRVSANALWNKTYGVDFEANGTSDIYCEGDNNFFNGVDSGFASGEGIRFTTGAKGNQVVGGSHSDIIIDSGAVGNLIADLTVNRFGDGSAFTDNGTNTRCDNVYDYGNAVWLNCQGYHVATSITDNVGVQTPVGTVTNTQTALDGNVYNMPENNSDPGIDLDFNFTNVKQIKGVVVNCRYVGGTTHYIGVYIRDYTAGVDRSLMNFSTTVFDNYRTVLIPDDTNFIDISGNARLSFIHSSVTGILGHDLYIDYVALLT